MIVKPDCGHLGCFLFFSIRNSAAKKAVYILFVWVSYIINSLTWNDFVKDITMLLSKRLYQFILTSNDLCFLFHFCQSQEETILSFFLFCKSLLPWSASCFICLFIFLWHSYCCSAILLLCLFFLLISLWLVFLETVNEMYRSTVVNKIEMVFALVELTVVCWGR